LLTLAGIFMSTENENQDLTDEQLSDVFNEMADTFDKEAGIDRSETLTDTSIEGDEDADVAANIPPAADAQTDVVNEPAEEVFDINSLPAVAQKKFQELEHSAKSQSGRVSALQRQADEYKTQLDEHKAQLEKLQQQGKGDSAAAQKLEEEIEATELDLGALGEELPELKPFVDELNKLRKQVSGMNTVVQEKVITPAEQRAAQEAAEREESALADAHKDKAEIESNPRFWEWVDSQHESVRKLADSSKAADASYLISLYKQANPPASPDPEANTKPKINRSVDDMVVLPKNSQVSSSVVDENSAFEWAAGQIEQGKL
jgi:chromosome segregation ATPase